MKKERNKRVAVDLPDTVYNALSKLADDKVTSRSLEGAKAIVLRLKSKGLLEENKNYL